MSFFSKRPCMQPRVLSASQCPPHNEVHDVHKYPEYYDSLYFPEDYPFLFKNEQSVCQWLLKGLQSHYDNCLSCLHSPNLFKTSNDIVRCVPHFFRIDFCSIQLFVSHDFVQSSSFSFCGLHRIIVLTMNKLQDTSFSSGEWSMHAHAAITQVPSWFLMNDQYLLERVSALPVSVLQKTIEKIQVVRRLPRVKIDFIQIIMNDFINQCLQLVSKHRPSNEPFTVLVSQYFSLRYGDACASIIRDIRQPNHFQAQVSDITTSTTYNDTWMNMSFDNMLSRLNCVTKDDVLHCLHAIPSYLRPSYRTRSVISCRTAVALHIQSRVAFLDSLSIPDFFEYFLSVLPFATDFFLCRITLTEHILIAKYGPLIISTLRTPPLTQSQIKCQRRLRENNETSTRLIDSTQEICSHWPSVVPDNIVFECLKQYQQHTVWTPPLVCCVCGLNRPYETVKEVIINHDQEPTLNFSSIHVKDPLITNVSDFDYGFQVLNGTVLDKTGFRPSDDDQLVLQICNDCHSALKLNHVPRLSLANFLYRGRLPDELQDLTWIEEMVCAKYRNTAHVSRIYGSSDPSQPKIFHGNTCAHEMNVMSTASILPRTIADINDMLTVVFVGPTKFDPNCLKPLFTIRKQKVWAFLLWLTTHNHLYFDIHLDRDIMNTYPDNDLLPGIKHNIFEEHNLDPSQTYAEETTGFAEHPAQTINKDCVPGSSLFLMEKMGVSDPDASKISGRTSTALALKKLVPSNCPDLVLHRSSQAIPEYNNPDLMPGMFPTLFPLGLGGFDNPARSPKLSFQSHANALLDIPDKSFRRHQTFIFVVLNIMQRRLCHLHTHFTVRKSNFDFIATKLTSLSPQLLTRVADHLQQEGCLSALNDNERDAMHLLKHVNTISARVPGSQSAKIFARNEIRSYFGEFGLPHLFFTFNPSVTHSPIFEVMAGDQRVDLTSQFPFVVPSKERSIRVVDDPVAASDFFDFCVTSIFCHLFGWDYSAQRATENGGILGHLKAFYGTSEFTERGSLHGHFVIWLLGGLNPNEIHIRLKEDAEFKNRFFTFFEDIIQHDLPQVDVVIDSDYEPRVERPPSPPKSSGKIPIEEINEWQSFMQTEVKKLGEILQRHKCKPVCHKYGNDDKCRFLFPHDIELSSYFESTTNSVILKCLDSMINYFNRYILVYCRHNHDLKCILSGKAAKAAMCYITEYITKTDMKTYQMLSLLSRAVAAIPEDPELPVRQRGRILLHKCLAQFTRQQQIHAQQAARYLRGHDDTITSHKTTPMMSGLLLNFVRAEYGISTDHISNCEDEDTEHAYLTIQKDHNGNLIKHNQLTDYWYRSHTLYDMNFYDFSRCVTLQPKRKSDFTNERLGVQPKHTLLPEHPLTTSHNLVQHTIDNYDCAQTVKHLVPRPIGLNIPRQHTGEQWMIFTLAHFKPFDANHALIDEGKSVEECYQTFKFAPKDELIMKNWEDVHECEDKRDEERLLKRAAATAESLAMTKSLEQISEDFENEFDDLDNLSLPTKNARKDFVTLQAIHVLEQSKWLTSQKLVSSINSNITPISKSITNFPSPTTLQIKEWMKSLKQQEMAIAHIRQNGHVNVTHNVTPATALETNHVDNVMPTTFMPIRQTTCSSLSDMPYPHLTTSNNNHKTKLIQNLSSPEHVIKEIGEQHNLQCQQWIAFDIISRSFIQRYIYKQNVEKDPLRMLLTGPGGTGKTHVVKALQKVMEFYNAAHTIRFLAPTGSAASLIDGMTIHKGLGIKVQSNEKGKGNRNLNDNHEDYSVIISVQNKIKLREEWRNVQIVMIDECSLLSAELLSEIDAALRFAKETPDKWFGGIIVIFAGDFYQYPPVCATPLYNSILPNAKTSPTQLAKRLGRLGWKSINEVVNFTEQKCMKDDATYATAVTHLRTRECTIDDMDLFNTRIIKSACYENGIDMSIDNNFNATAIVRTNLLRQTMNIRKAQTNCLKMNISFTTVAALDSCPTINLTDAQIQHLLHLDMTSSKIKDALPGFLPLYIGMPVILKCKNISTDLGITNGSQGYVRDFYTTITTAKYTHCTCAIVEFSHSKVKLPNLPLSYFPITPVKTSFTTFCKSDTDQKLKLKITRQQLPIQPAFAVTGHSAEGKTLPHVLTDLHEGGFGAYVAASRARSRHGLYITQSVTLNDLNKPLPYPLLQETKRLNALEHNTYIRHGFRHGDYELVPDPESEQHITHTKLIANFDTPQFSFKSSNDVLQPLPIQQSQNQSLITNKRKSDLDVDCITASSSSLKHVLSNDCNRNISNAYKRQHLSIDQSTSIQSISSGCTWSSTDWSCAYDCAIMSLFYAYLYFDNDTISKWAQETAITADIITSFRNLTISHENMRSPTKFNIVRDRLRDTLSNLDPVSFARHGPVGAPADLIFDHVKNHELLKLCICYSCSSTTPCRNISTLTIDDKIPNVFISSLWTTWCQQINNDYQLENATTQDWMDLAFQSKKNSVVPYPISHESNCPGNASSIVCRVFINDPPPILTIEVELPIIPNYVPTKTLKINTLTNIMQYNLRAVVYLAHFHFTSRLFDAQGNVWIYDGQKNEGSPSFECTINDLQPSQITTMQEGNAHLYIYTMQH